MILVSFILGRVGLLYLSLRVLLYTRLAHPLQNPWITYERQMGKESQYSNIDTLAIGIEAVEIL